jgi:predicted RNA-binding protein with RPS1 domain
MDKGIPFGLYTQRITVGGKLSEEVRVMSGVLRGSILGLLLLLLQNCREWTSHINTTWLLGNDRGRMWTEAMWPIFRYYPDICLAKLRKIMKTQQKSLAHIYIYIATKFVQKLRMVITLKTKVYINCMGTETKMSESLIIRINRTENNKAVKLEASVALQYTHLFWHAMNKSFSNTNTKLAVTHRTTFNSVSKR